VGEEVGGGEKRWGEVGEVVGGEVGERWEERWEERGEERWEWGRTHSIPSNYTIV